MDTSVHVPLRRLPQHQFRILSDDEVNQVWLSRYLSGRSPIAIRNPALIGLMLDAGIRRAEIRNLQIKDVDFDNGYLLESSPSISCYSIGWRFEGPKRGRFSG